MQNSNLPHKYIFVEAPRKKSEKIFTKKKACVDYTEIRDFTKNLVFTTSTTSGVFAVSRVLRLCLTFTV
jgi:hypothetical protein